MASRRKTNFGDILFRLSDPRSAKAAWLEMLQEDPEKAWPLFANHLAKSAHEKDFPTRSGYYVLNGFPTASGQAVCLFNNNPDKGSGNKIDNRRREKELAAFRQRIEATGIKELGYGGYPLPWEEQGGYTYAIILDVSQSNMGIFLAAINEAKREAWDWYSKNRLEDPKRRPSNQVRPEPPLVIEEDVPHERTEGEMDPLSVPPSVSVGVTSLVTQARVGQDAFSRAVRENYEHRCCFPGCEVDHDALLIAAHIARWADNSAIRGDISNGLCLCGLHDKAFEAGFFTLADDLTVKVDLHKAPQSAWMVSLLQVADGRQIKLGIIRPSLEAIREHRNRHTECPEQKG